MVNYTDFPETKLHGDSQTPLNLWNRKRVQCTFTALINIMYSYRRDLE